MKKHVLDVLIKKKELFGFFNKGYTQKNFIDLFACLFKHYSATEYFQ
jgi:hypothetical protein